MPEPSGSALTLGLDLGTSAVKAALVADTGEVLATAGAPFPTHADEPGAAEQNPADWLDAVARACRALDGAALAHWRTRVVAVGLAGQLPTLVCGTDDHALGRAITWKDARADAWATRAISVAERRTLYARTGMPIDGRYLGPMFRHHYAGREGAIGWILSAKDYLCLALTGRRVTDPSTAAGYAAFDLETGEFAADLCARWQLPATALPEVRQSGDVAGALTTEGAALVGLPAGLPVLTGAADSVAGAYALGGLRTGAVTLAMGSSTIILDAVRERRLDSAGRYLLTPHVARGWYGREMDLLATGTGYAWLSGLLGWREGELERAAARSSVGAAGLCFAPYLAGGEQGALWNPALTGTLSGLRSSHTAADIARAFLEGVYFEIARCVDVLQEGSPADEIIVAGHLFAHPESRQMLADVLSRPVRTSRLESAAAVGAALLARPGEHDASPSPATADPAIGPGPAAGAYAGEYRRYLERHPA